MEASALAEFFSAIGNRVIKTESCYWYNSEPFLYKSLPVHRYVNPSAAEIAKVLMLGPALALRYPKPFDPNGPHGASTSVPIATMTSGHFPRTSAVAHDEASRGAGLKRSTLISSRPMAMP